jgi:hypothetical protein
VGSTVGWQGGGRDGELAVQLPVVGVVGVVELPAEVVAVVELDGGLAGRIVVARGLAGRLGGWTA